MRPMNEENSFVFSFCRISMVIAICLGHVAILPAQEDAQPMHDDLLKELLDAKISTASKYEQTISEAPASVTIITGEDIKRYGFRTLEEILRSVRGFYVSNDRNYSYLGVRGFGRPTDYNNRILLLLNGHTMNENVYGSASVGTEFGLGLELIERLEIVRGPGSALYGTSAMFAVINIITKTGKARDGFMVGAETGSYARRRGVAGFGKELKNGMELFVSGQWAEVKGQNLYFQEYDTPSTNNGVANDLDKDKFYGLFTTITYRDFSLQGMLASREKQIPTGAWEVTFNDPAAESVDKRSFIEMKYDAVLAANKKVMLRAYFDNYYYEEVYPYDGINTFDASNGNWLGGEGQFRWDLRANNRLIAGAEFNKHLDADYRLWNADTTFFDQNFPFHVISFYAQDEYQALENLFFTMGLRHDEYSTAGSSTPLRGAVVYNPMRTTTLKLLYGEAFRAPNVYEVNYDDPLGGYKANANLKPETIRTMEVVWEQRLSDELFGVASYYYYRVKNLIDQIVDPADSLTFYQNVNKANAHGLDVELNLRSKTGIHGRVSYSIQQAGDANTKQRLTNSPRHILQLAASSAFISPLQVAAEMKYESARRTVQDTSTRSYFLTNLNLTTTPSFHKHLEFSFLINNLFDVNYQTPGGLEHKQPAITQNGRNFIFGVGYTF